MALVSSPPLPYPGAPSSPTSPTPASIPGPAATPKGASLCRTAFLSSPAPGTTSSFPETVGRPKALRWSNDSPPTGKSGGGAPSYVEILLTGVLPAAASQASDASVATGNESPRSSPRYVIQNGGGSGTKVSSVPDADGWTDVMSRRRRREQRRQEFRSRRPVPVDLRGKCFNCFSPSHRAASCRTGPRWFRCRALGHRSFRCPLQSGGLRHEAPHLQQLVWRSKSSAAGMAAPPATAAAASNVAGGSQGRRKRRRSRRNRNTGSGRSEGSPGNGEGGSTPVASSGDELPAHASPRPRQILDRSTSISQREDGLAKAVVISVINGTSDHILATIASRFEIEVPSMSLLRLGDARFLLILPNAELAERVCNGGRPLISTSPPLQLHIRRWTRLLDSKGASLVSPVEVDIRGMPAHAWELATAELLLSNHCWIAAVHPDVADRRDVFKVVA
ncbi:unnamed protein product [Urochloa humidicola]